VAKTAITCNSAEPSSIFPSFILGSAAAACGDEVVLFFTPDGSPALVKGELEKIKGKGMPELIELVEGLQVLGGRILLCELAFGANDIKREDLREGVEVVDASTFLNTVQDAQLTFSF